MAKFHGVCDALNQAQRQTKRIKGLNFTSVFFVSNIKSVGLIWRTKWQNMHAMITITVCMKMKTHTTTETGLQIYIKYVNTYLKKARSDSDECNPFLSSSCLIHDYMDEAKKVSVCVGCWQWCQVIRILRSQISGFVCCIMPKLMLGRDAGKHDTQCYLQSVRKDRLKYIT